MKITNETSKTVEISYYGKGAIIEAGKSFDIASERIGDFITVRSEDGEVSIFRGFDSRTVTEIGNLKASNGKLPMEVIIHNWFAFTFYPPHAGWYFLFYENLQIVWGKFILAINKTVKISKVNYENQ